MPVNLGIARTRILVHDQDADTQPDPGDKYSYELILTNSGDVAATGVSIDATENGYTISNVLIGPIGIDDTIAVTVAGNTPYTFNASTILGNDLDPDDATPNLTITHIQGTAVVTGTPIAVTNGTVTSNGDGTFTFRPAAGYEGVASFTYNTVDSDGIASVSTTPATVTINVGEAVWYVDSTGGSDVTGNGTYENPFASLAPLSTGGTADALDDSNDTIFVYANGANAYTSGIVLEQGQVLRGEGVTADFIVNGITISSVATDTQIDYTTFGVQLSSGNTIQGIDFVGGAAGAVAIVDGAATVGTLTVSDTEISGLGQIIDVDQGGALNVTLESAASTGSSGANGGVIDLAGVTGTFTVSGATAISGTHGQAGIDVGGAGTNLALSFAGGTTLTMGAQGGVNLTTNSGSANFANLDITNTTGAAFIANGLGGLTITGADNDFQTSTGQLLSLTNTGLGASGATFDTLTATGTVVGNAIDINNLDSFGLTVGGNVTIANSSADAINIRGGSSTNVTFNGVTGINGATGDGVELNGANGSVYFNDLRVDAVGGHGMQIVDATNTVTVAGGAIGASDDPAGDGVNVANGSGAVTIAANITKTTAGNVVEVNNHDSGNITFSGTLSASGTADTGILVSNSNGGTIAFTSGATKALNTGAGAGVSLTSNSGATINFSNGGLDIDTTGGTGFNATGGGTINVSGANSTITSTAGGAGINLNAVDATFTGGGLDIDTVSGTGLSAAGGGTLSVTGSNNSITSTSATALNVNGTTIAASDLTFRSISAGNNTAAADPVNGIVLNNTGSSGGLTVTGSDGGDANTFPDAGSGGTIQNTTGDGIQLTNTMDVTLGGMTLTGNKGDGIGGSGVNGFVLDGANITGNGDTDLTDESGINITGLTGTAIGGLHPTEIRNSTISNNHEFEIQITNSSGTLNDFRLTDSTVSSNGATGVHGNLFNFLSTGTATMGLTVAGSTFTGSTTAGQLTGAAIMADASGGTMNANIGTSSFTNNNVGVLVSAATNGVMTFNVHDNPVITGNRAYGVRVFTNANHTGTISGTIANNTVGTQGVAGSGSALGQGIAAQIEGGGTGTLAITGNTVQSMTGFNGIQVTKSVTAGTLNATVTNNLTRDIPQDRGIIFNLTIAGGVLNVNASGNQFINVAGPAGDPNASVLRIDKDFGDLNVTQTSQANLAVVNSGIATTKVSVSGTIDYGQPAPPLPLLAEGLPGAPDDSLPTGGNDDHGTGGGIDVQPPVPDEPADDGIVGDDGSAGGGEVVPTAPADPASTDPAPVDDHLLSQAELDGMIEAAIQRWVDAGATPEQIAAMRATSFTVADMSANYLAASQPGTVQVDSDGAGHGWFIDTMPGDDAEYQGAGTRLTAVTGEAVDRMDLLTVLMHELGHQVGLGDLYSSAQADELMYGYASLGSRRLPGTDDLASADLGEVGHNAFVVLTPSVGALPAGRAVRVIYTATVNSYANEQIANPFSNTITVSGGNFSNVVFADGNTIVDSLTLGGTVWFDNGAGGGVAANGFKNGTEAGIVGVTLSLFADANNDDVPDTPGTALATTITDGGGNYSFANLAAGNYIVRVDSGNFGAGNPLVNRATTAGEPDPDINDPDIDNDDNGYASGGAVFSHNITLAYNTEPTAGVGNDSNLTLDFGFAAANQLPAFTSLNGTPSFTEGGVATVLDADATVSDPDLTGTNYAGATLTLARSGAASGDDLFGTTGTLSFVGANVDVGGTVVGTFTQSAGTLVITFNASATQALVNSTLQGLTYSNTSDTPPASAVIAYAFSDGNSGSQGVGGAGIANGSVTVSITAVDDAAVAVADPGNSTPENATTSIAVLANDSDLDGPALAVAEVDAMAIAPGGTVTLASGATVKLELDGTLTYDPNGKFNYLISTATAGATLAVNDSASDNFTYKLAGGNAATVTMTVTGVTSAGDQLWGDAGNNIIDGTPAGIVFNLGQGGDDTATGQGGNDGFYMGAELSALDVLDGGGGILDQLGLQGNYGAPFVFGASHLTNIEMLVLLSGSDTRFGDTSGGSYSYNLKTIDANVGAGKQMAVSFNSLLAGENVTFDGSDESDGWFLTFGGLGNDALIGGDQDDRFYFGNNGLWGAGDSVDGGAGILDQLGLQGSYTVTFGAGQLTGIEMLVLLTGGDTRFGNPAGTGYSYNMTMDDGNVGNGQMFYVSANTLRAGVPGVSDETLVFDGSAESDGRFTIYSGDGDDTLTGGDQDDKIYGASGADTMTGGLGNDTFAYMNAAHSTTAAMDQILDFSLGDKIDLSAIDAITGGANDAFSFIASSAFSNIAGQLRAFDTGGGIWQIQGDLDGNGIADLVIAVTTAQPLIASTDFIL